MTWQFKNWNFLSELVFLAASQQSDAVSISNLYLGRFGYFSFALCQQAGNNAMGKAIERKESWWQCPSEQTGKHQLRISATFEQKQQMKIWEQNTFYWLPFGKWEWNKRKMKLEGTLQCWSTIDDLRKWKLRMWKRRHRRLIVIVHNRWPWWQTTARPAKRKANRLTAVHE